uniref:Uncharacterized protein n=1 Tax=Romanomermis culicivorax TaxID=13658 RepID=A0A915HML1_ROMCU
MLVGQNSRLSERANCMSVSAWWVVLNFLIMAVERYWLLAREVEDQAPGPVDFAKDANLG